MQYLFQWAGLDLGTPYSCWKDLKDIVERANRDGLRIPRFLGHDKDGARKADSAATNKILKVIEFLKNRRSIKAVIFIRDLDNQPERRPGIEQACSNYRNAQSPLAIVIGTPNRMREAWVLNGFIPLNEQETQILQEIKSLLNFDPCEESHRLRSNSREEPERIRNPKVALERLTGSDPAREQQCWETTSLEILHQRGKLTGLTAYLKEVEQWLMPMITT